MSFDRSMRNALAALLLVAALFVAMNHIVASAPFADWWQPILLFIVGAALAFAPQMRRGQPDEDAETAPPAGDVHTYELTASHAPQLPTETPDASIEAPEILPFAEASAAPAVMGQEQDGEGTADGENDLTKISGIGKKSAAALQAAGIDSFHKLANSSNEAISAALTGAGVRLVGDIDTWAQQAAYAARGDWAGLDRFNTERRPTTGD